MGRPTKLTPEVQAKVVQALETGHYAEDAVIIAGIGENTYYQWLEKGAAGTEPYAAFREAVESASRQAVDRSLKRVMGGDLGWQGSAWFLERRFPMKWGRRDPDHALKTKQLESDLAKSAVEIDTLRAKLKMLEAGQDPDAQPVVVVTRGWKQS